MLLRSWRASRLCVFNGNRRLPAFRFSTLSQQEDQTPLISDSMDPNTAELHTKLVQGDRASLARAITLVESSRSDHQKQAQLLLERCMTAPGHQRTLKPSFRLAFSGPPGVGKSTFLDQLGMHLIRNCGLRVAVLAVDPSSGKTGGSILGDKTRMENLSKAESAYVRATPSRGELGGVAKATMEAMILCEAAGYDVTLVETVGVGQSETMVADMVDMFVLLVPPGGGDELQGMKKGIIEYSDMILINKCDGDFKALAVRTQLEYVSALKLLKPALKFWRPPVLSMSAEENRGIKEAWDKMFSFYKLMNTTDDSLRKKRQQQRVQWMWRHITSNILKRFKTDTRVKKVKQEVEDLVKAGQWTPARGAENLLDLFQFNQTSSSSSPPKK